MACVRFIRVNPARGIHGSDGAVGQRPGTIALRVSPSRINDIARERRAMSADTALRLSRDFGTSAEFWLGLQSDYDMKIVLAGGEQIKREVLPIEQAA